ncbi:PREDICTED: DDB1- and CUL4-associated factor 11 [Thamnophis sirtalis]|uniref:DDB1- and CUL4-associated factor 11 n=1 Tax=Thamnophis sirtalis TaxID=35019 RepID=A0A6I9YLB3_9SAUR|nr:PREDICTED: DDB1- and CUL4-associated factor 11 [Thamnophis sirtalis]
MGSRSSSNAGSGGRENQGSWSRRDSGILRSEDEDNEDVDLAQVLAYLLRRGQFHLMQGGGTASARVFQAVSDSDDDTDSAWEGRLGDQYKPPGIAKKSRVVYLTRIMLLVAKLCPTHRDPMDNVPPGLRIRLYDCTYGAFRNFRSVKARDVGWSVLDVAFTPDRTHFLYSSWSDYIHICNIYGESETQTALDLRPDERRFAVFSLAVSSDGREVLGGANYGCVYVFDMEQNKRTLKVLGVDA